MASDSLASPGPSDPQVRHCIENPSTLLVTMLKSEVSAQNGQGNNSGLVVLSLEAMSIPFQSCGLGSLSYRDERGQIGPCSLNNYTPSSMP